MHATMTALLSLLLIAPLRPADAFWRMSCGRIQMGRVDPIISPGGISGHAHTISGPINFNTTSTFDSMQAAYCTSCGIQDDKSAYWTPQLYYRYRNGSFTEVPNGGTVVYYLSRGDAELSMIPFPPGYRILAGDSAVRQYMTKPTTYGTSRPVADRVSFACLNYDNPSPETPGLSRTDCPGGLRAQVHLPSCWDGINLYKSDQSHAAYLSGIDTGICPPGYPKVFPHLFIEVIYSVNNVNPEKGGYFVFSNGDTTGYGFHADFLNGWNPKVLQDSINQCMGTGRAINNGDILQCPALNKSYDQFFDKNCPEQPPIVKEQVKGLLKVLPGCNPPTGGPLRAAQNICPVQPGLNNVVNTDGIIRLTPQPGDRVGDFQYLGCANDKGALKTLVGDVYQDSKALTIEKCSSYCKAGGWAYAGVENGYQCYCGNALENPILDATTCTAQSQIVCNGNSLQYCGGQNLVHVYNDTRTTVKVRGLPVPGQTKITVPGSSKQATYAGCYPEPSGGRMLTSATFSNQTGMTNEMCALFCNTAGYNLFGTEYAAECYCGSSVVTQAIAQGNCTSICKGDKTQFCGQGGKLSLWTFNGTVPYNAPSSPTNTAGTGGSTSAPSNVPTASGITYVGCQSETGSRALAADFTDSTSMSVDLCAQRAQTLNYRYFGLEYASQCLIGDYLNPASTVLAAGKCNLACKGNAGQFCGGQGAFNMYNNTLYTPRVAPTISLPAQGASYAFKGCYSKGSGEALSGGMAKYADDTVNLNTCAALCNSKGYSWMGVEYGRECSCNNLGPQNGASLSANGAQDCNMACKGSGTQNCGASGKVQIYQKVAGGNSRIVSGKRRRGVVGMGVGVGVEK